jgi:hypothetical protein
MATRPNTPKDRKAFDAETKAIIAEAATAGKTTVMLGGVQVPFAEFLDARDQAAKVVYAGAEDQRGRDLVENDHYRFRGGMVRLTDEVIDAISQVEENHDLLLHVTNEAVTTGYLVAWNDLGHITVSPTVKNR